MSRSNAFPVRAMPLQPPTRWIPLRRCVLREERERATLIGCSDVVVFCPVALERPGDKLVDRDCAHATATNVAQREHSPVNSEENHHADDDVRRDSAKSSHE